MKNDNKKRPILLYCILGLGVLMLINTFLFSRFLDGELTMEVSYNVFLDELEAKNIDLVQVNDDTIRFSLIDESAYREEQRAPLLLYPEESLILYCVRMDDPDLVNRLYAAGATFAKVEPSSAPLIIQIVLSYVLPILIFVVFFRFLTKRMGGLGGGNVMSFGKSGAKIYANDETGTTFADVAGQEEAKESLLEIVDFLHDPKRYEEIGAKLPKGALLVGPPGTGKTLLAKAVAGEAKVPFFSISGSEFVEMFVGMGAAKVRDLFKQANDKAPCIVFIDEIDTIGKKRDGSGLAGNDEREQTLNQLLSEMDGFDGRKGVVILAATNRPDTLDQALLRPGRFDRRIPVELPDLRGREAILRVHGKKVKLDDSVEFSSIAKATPGASGAELANIINEAALRAVRQGRQLVSQQDLEESVDVILAGQKRKGAVISPHEKEIVAHHEVGHAIAAAVQSDSAPVTKITIIPRTSGALGFTMQVDEDEKFLLSREEAFNKLVTYTAGRVAEELIFGSVTSGASNDIEMATRLARAMIARYGMSDDVGMVALETVSNRYLGGDASLACSDETATLIDREVIALIGKAHDRARELLEANEPKLREIARCLIDRETITGAEFMDILHAPIAEAAEAEAAESEAADAAMNAEE